VALLSQRTDGWRHRHGVVAPKLGGDLVVGRYPIGQPGIDHGLHRVGEHLALAVVDRRRRRF
jgi:hypothetical protein